MSNMDWQAPSGEEARGFIARLSLPRARAVALDIRSHCFRFDPARFGESVAVPLGLLLAQTRELVSEINARCDPPSDVFHALHDGMLISDGSGDVEWGRASHSLLPLSVEVQMWKRVGDVCFGASHELASRALHVSAVDDEHALAQADSARRRLIRAVDAVSRAIAEARGDELPPVPCHVDELECSVAVRRAYARFREAVHSCQHGAPDCVARALRLSAVAFAVLFGSLDARDLRVRDQRLLRSLQQRLFAWARGPREEIEGTRLLQDIVSTAELLRAVNMRQELRASDTRVIERALASIPDARDLSAVSSWVGTLSALYGRDDDLNVELLLAKSQGADPCERISAISRRLRELHEPALAQAGTFF